jgi:hypothetical protein
MRTPPYTIVYLLDEVQLFVRERARRESLAISTMPIAIVRGRSLHVYHGMMVFWPRCSESCRCTYCTMLSLTLEATQATNVAQNLWRSNKPIVPTIRSRSTLSIHGPVWRAEDYSLEDAIPKLAQAHLRYTHDLIRRDASTTGLPKQSELNILVVDDLGYDFLAEEPTYDGLITIATNVRHACVGG